MQGSHQHFENGDLMGTGIPIFHQVHVTIVVAENDTSIRLQIERSNPTILAQCNTLGVSLT